ncbi:MAG: energy transducer TonB [Piscirickettsiaceae bacterium]|nr:MAG: energy transducer TonB [Piscirickettsiaceae bacterium]PCI69992.1 MAG: energy transducer TonB [Piscirickettsiaceae bacterium]
MAGVVHALVILGVSFDVDVPKTVGKMLEIVLVKTPDIERPDKADFLAQENQVGSGEADEKAINQQQASFKAQALEKVVANDVKTQKAAAKAKKILLQEQSKIAVEASNKPIPDEEKQLTAVELLKQAQEIAQLEAEIQEAITSYSRRPRKLHINSINAHKYKAASYEAAWQRKVERVGNLNYPGEVRRKKLSGTLVLSVELYADGNLKKIIINRRSGHKVIDDAAINIVKLAAPFAPLPIELRKDVDILVITRTWQFLNEGGLRTK